MSLTVVIAPMFSGKTTYLLNKASIVLDLGFKPLFITHALETRSSEIFTHSSLIKVDVGNKFPVLKLKSFDNINLDDLDKYTHIFIDEYQFFEEVSSFFIDIFVKKNKHVYVAGLKSDYNKQKMGYTLDLIAMADEVVFLKSSCLQCARTLNGIETPAAFTKRILKSNKVIEVGGKDEYEPVCRKHL
jgi:thymidine kinase